jgi:hypothetical protein
MKLIKWFKNIFSADWEKERDEAYLNEAVDIIDLEYRMKKLDERRQYKNGLGY